MALVERPLEESRMLPQAKRRAIVLAIALVLATGACAAEVPLPSLSFPDTSSTQAEVPLPSLSFPDTSSTQLPEPALGAGREWRVIESPALDGANLFEVTAVGDLLLAAGNQGGSGVIWTSVDGVEWELAQPASVFEGTLIWGLMPWDGGVMALGGANTLAFEPPPVILTSTDGRVWQESPIDACWHDFESLTEGAIADEALILVGSLGRQPGGGAVCRLADEGPALPDEDLFGGSILTDVAASGSSVLVVAAKNTVGVPTDPAAPGAWLSTDNGVSFSEVPMSDRSGEARGVAVTDDGYLVVGTEDGPVAWRSADGSTWEVVKLGSAGEAYDVVRGAAGFVAVGIVGDSYPPTSHVWLSTDGSVWEEIAIPHHEGGRMHAVTPWGAGYAAVGGDLVWLSP